MLTMPKLAMTICLASSTLAQAQAQAQVQGQISREQGEEGDISSERGEVPDEVSLQNAVIAGSGCAVGDGMVSLVDASTLVFVSDRLVARISPNGSLGDSRRNCATAINLAYPAGWTFAVKQVWLESSAHLDAGTEAKVSGRLNFQGNNNDYLLERSLSGPVDTSHDFGTLIGDEELRFAPCDAARALIINLSVAVNNIQNRQGSARVSLGNRHGNAAVFDLVWKRCGDEAVIPVE